ncbi:MAG: ATP-binding protein [Bacteriovorax sp.]|nr:ATP-binding protein [Bacteriovorax sp.]
MAKAYPSQQLSSVKVVRIFAGLTLIISFIVIIGWALSIPTLKSVLPTFITMKANTAISFIFCAIAALLIESETVSARRKIMARLCVVMVMTISFLTLAEYLFQYNFMIDELLFPDPGGVGGKFPPGRLAPITAINFILFGFAILLSTSFKKNYYQTAQIAIFLVFIISFQAFLGYFLGVTYTFGITFYSQMAIHTTMAFVFLCLAYLFSYPNRGFMALLASCETRAGSLVRNLTIAAIVIPPFVTWMCIFGERLGLYDSNFSILIRVVGNVIFFLLLVWKNGVTLHDLEIKDIKSERRNALLVHVAKELISSFDYRSNIKNVIQGIVPEMADLCLVNLIDIDIDKDGQILAPDIAYSHLITPPSPGSMHCFAPAKAILTGTSFYIKKWNDSSAVQIAQSDEHREIIRRLSPKSLIAVPITFQGKILGAFTAILIKEERLYEQEDFAWFEELAVRTATAINNALLYKELVFQSEEKEKRAAELVVANKAREEEIIFSTSRMSALGEMASGIAHEINNPLSIIIMKGSQLIRKFETDTLDQKELEEGLKKIVSTAQRIGKVVKGLSSISRNSEDDPMKKMRLDIVIEETIQLSRERYNSYSIKLHTDLAAIANIEIEGRASQIMQVLLNLLNNALDAVLPLPDKWIAITATPNDFGVVITMTDSGYGIPHQVLAKIMQPFFTTKEAGMGTGLGLSISKRMIEEHQGQFYYQKNLDHTCFVIELPYSQGANPSWPQL